jgi:MFS family permease
MADGLPSLDPVLKSDTIQSEAESYTSRYLYWIVFVFFLVNLVSQMDGVVLAILAEPIRRELGLNDSQLGLLRFAFSAFYALFGLAIGRLTDTWTRTRMLSISVGVFSVATVVCGFAQNFIQLFIMRVFVGVGEAGGVPTKYSMVGDIFSPAQRARVLALIQAGLGIGSLAGLMLAGVLADAVGWRNTFYVFGVPGLLLAILIAFTIREPKRGQFETNQQAVLQAPALSETLRSLSRNHTFICIVFAYSATTFGLTGIGYWMPSFIVRSYGMTLTEVGLYYGSISGFGFIIGLVIGAIATPRMLRADRRWEMRFPGIINFGVAAIYLAMFTMAEDVMTVFILAAVNSLLLGLTAGPASASIQSTISARMRGVAVAITMFVSSLIGQGLAPWLIGYFSDQLKPNYGDESLRLTLAASPILFLVGAILYLIGTRHFDQNRVD